MDLMNHDLAHEFPEHLEKMHELKTSDARFAKLFAQYDEDDHAIKKYELGAETISDDALENMKKERLRLKDEIYKILTGN
jgi:uncharacterized protein YdcH (DUF465 family)